MCPRLAFFYEGISRELVLCPGVRGTPVATLSCRMMTEPELVGTAQDLSRAGQSDHPCLGPGQGGQKLRPGKKPQGVAY